MFSKEMAGIQDDAGFSLLEMIVVLAILAVLLAVAWPVSQFGVNDRALEHSARDISGVLRAARLSAIMTSTPRVVTFDAATRTYAAEQVSGLRRLPPGISLAIDVGARNMPNNRRAAVRFLPDGSGTATVLHLQARSRRATIDVGGLTGRVRTRIGSSVHGNQ